MKADVLTTKSQTQFEIMRVMVASNADALGKMGECVHCHAL